MADPVSDMIMKDGGHAVEAARLALLRKRLGDESPVDAGALDDSVLLHELAVMERWEHAFDESEDGRGPKEEFHRLCGDCLEILKALPEPEDATELMLHRLKTVSYAYLGERWEEAQDMTRGSGIEAPGGAGGWNARVFASVFSAVMMLARKGAGDLDDASARIARLRKEQPSMEGPYLDGVEARYRRAAACELASLYHLSRCVEAAAEYMKGGSPRNVPVVLDMQFDKAVSYCRRSGQRELELVERVLHLVLKKMAENSVWSLASRSAHARELAGAHRESGDPVLELLYPQRAAVLDGKLLDPASRAVVISMPTSSGKTLMAELRIVQAVREDPDAWVAYVAPTRALVNQITARLRRSLRRLGIRVEKMSGAVDLDAFEDSMVKARAGSDDKFRVLVLTPEKMSLLIRRDRALRESLALAVIDEAHNLSDRSRGLHLEMLLATIKSDCDAGLLLLTPFLPNGREVARWLDQSAPRLIKEELGWTSGSSAVGLYYPKGEKRDVSVHFRPLLYTSSVGTPPRPPKRKEIKMGDAPAGMYTQGHVKRTKYVLTSLAAAQLSGRGNVLVVSKTVQDTWKTADELMGIMGKSGGADERLSLVKKFVAAELGDAFPLVRCLDYGIGVHNGGLPDEIRQLVEWLMGEGLLKVLVSTTTTAQGVDFPVSSVLLSSHRHPSAEMQPHEFWNIAGRAGRVGQRGIGLVGVAVDGPDTPKAKGAAEFIAQKVHEAASVLEGLIKSSSGVPDLRALSGDPEWSSFVQYVAHMYNQAGDLRDFASSVEMSMRNTYAYHRIGPEARRELIRAVDEYGAQLGGREEFARLSDMTGFSPETVEGVAERVSAMGMAESDWSGPGLFSGSRLPELVKGMVDCMPELRGLSDVKASSRPVGHEALGRIISDWVSGKSIPDIALAHFGGASVGPIRECVSAIYGKISQQAAWGLSAMQQVYAKDGDPPASSNLPAMVYYGVDSDEAVLMRMNSMPRSIAGSMGRAYARERPRLYEAKSSDVTDWLDELSESKWDSAIRKDARVSGSEYKRIWRNLAGVD